MLDAGSFKKFSIKTLNHQQPSSNIKHQNSENPHFHYRLSTDWQNKTRHRGRKNILMKLFLAILVSFSKEMKIGTFMITPKELFAIKHHFVGNLFCRYYSIGQYETDALKKK